MLIFFLLARGGLPYDIRLGAYILITPLAMIIACMVVTQRHKLTEEERAIQKQAEMFIRPAGDLPERRLDSYGK